MSKDNDRKEYDYGFTEAFLATAPEIAKLVEKAAKEDWSPERFQAAYRDTAWFKRNQESVRAYETQRTMDPATWNANVSARMQELEQQLNALGAGKISEGALNKLARESMKYQWNQQQLAAALVTYIDFGREDGSGTAFDLQSKYAELARQNGVLVSEEWLQSRAKSVVSMNSTTEQVESELRNLAASAFPAFAEQLKAGQSLSEVASPYLQSMAAMLEINPNDLDLRDNTLRSALQATDKDGKPAAKSLFDFEKSLRKDPRWMQTKNAREELSGVARQVLVDFGLAS